MIDLRRHCYCYLIIVMFVLIGPYRASAADALGDTRGSVTIWNDFYHSGTTAFKPYTGYRISFHYKVIARNSNSDFYIVVNDLTHHRRTFDWQEWNGSPGDTGLIQTLFIDRDTDTYNFVIGLHNQGAIQISHLVIAADPKLKPLNLSFPITKRTWTSGHNSTYYIDSKLGSDNSDGKSVSSAWRTLNKVNTGILAPGDKILLRSGSNWSGYLSIAGSGSPSSPILIDRYGTGPKPIISAHGRSLASLYLGNCSYIRVANLDISNEGREPQPKLVGVEVAENNVGTAHQVVLDNLDVHDITGSELKSEGGGAGIDCTCIENLKLSNFDGLTIENCHLTRTDRNGITMAGAWTRDAWFPSRHVIIRNNVLTDIGGDGIVPVACDGAIIEHNILRGGRMRAPDFAAGIWPWSCDNTVIEYNDVSGMRGTKDGEGFDSDWNCRNSLFQYNFSHNNDGGFILICDDGTTYMPYNIGNSGTVVRYNVSVNDGQFTFYVSGPVSNTNIYNNTIYLGQNAAARLLQSGTWGWAWPNSTKFTNNVFYTRHPTDFDFGGMSNVRFSHNSFWGSFEKRPLDSAALLVNPQISRPGGSLAIDYRPSRYSPLLHRGVNVQNNGLRDFLGDPILDRSNPTIGAFQG